MPKFPTSLSVNPEQSHIRLGRRARFQFWGRALFAFIIEGGIAMNNLKSRKGGASLRNLKRLLCLLLVLTMLPINAFASDIIVPGSGGTSPGSGGGGSGTKWSSPTNLGPGMLLHVQSSERTVTFDYTDPANVVLGCVGTLQNRHLGWMYTSVYGSQRRQGLLKRGPCRESGPGGPPRVYPGCWLTSPAGRGTR